MARRWEIRPATADDCAAISKIVVRTVQETNTKDYPPQVIAEVTANFSPERVAERLSGREVFVATERGMIVGTASLDGTTVRSVFVLPEFQKRGVGRALLDHIEDMARRRGIARLDVPASVSAEGFYQRIGYTALRDAYYGVERTIIMEKAL